MESEVGTSDAHVTYVIIALLTVACALNVNRMNWRHEGCLLFPERKKPSQH